MTVIDYYQQDYHSFLKDIAPKVNGVFKDKFLLHFDQSSITGYARANKVSDDLTYLIMELRTHKEFSFNLIPDEGAYYILHLQTIEDLQEKELQPDQKLLFSETTYEQELTYPAKSKVKMLSVCIKKEWLQERLPCISKDDCVLEQIGNYIKEPVSSDYLYIFNDIVKMTNDHRLAGVHENNRVMQLIEMFLKRSLKKSSPEKTSSIKESEIKRLQEIEKILAETVTGTAPSLKQLSRIAGMSESSLKVKFKKVYGTGISVYYRRCKMLKAKEMLQSGKYSIKEIGIELGYINLGHFSGAFRKEFNVLPSEMIVLN